MGSGGILASVPRAPLQPDRFPLIVLRFFRKQKRPTGMVRQSGPLGNRAAAFARIRCVFLICYLG